MIRRKFSGAFQKLRSPEKLRMFVPPVNVHYIHSSSFSSLSHAYVNLEWRDTIKLPNLLLPRKVALSKAYNYYLLQQFSWPWNNLVSGPWVHPMYEVLLCNALIRWRNGSILVYCYSSASCVCAPGSSGWSPSPTSTLPPQMSCATLDVETRNSECLFHQSTFINHPSSISCFLHPSFNINLLSFTLQTRLQLLSIIPHLRQGYLTYTKTHCLRTPS